ncbi:MAG: hypothetical protein WBD20_27195 [Pirellulaceae bacterium]
MRQQLVAEDRVWLAPSQRTAADSTWYARSIEQVRGTVLQLDDRQLRIKISGNTDETLVAAHRVLWIESDEMPADAIKAVKLYSDGKYGESVRPFLDGLKERPPVWRQQWLSMMAAEAAWRSSRPTIALELVSQLDARPLPPIAIAWLPIDWDGSVDDRTNETAALEKLDDASPAVRLVAASWLVKSRSRRQAVAVLEQLALDNQRPLIARLAEIVSWRATLPPEIAGRAVGWQRKVDALPIVLQTGPLQSLASTFQAAGLADAAKRLQLSLELTPVAPRRGP